jgi:hypothetical protein
VWYSVLDSAPTHHFTDPGSGNVTLDVGKDATAWQFAKAQRDSEGAAITHAVSMRQGYSSAHLSLLVGRAMDMKAFHRHGSVNSGKSRYRQPFLIFEVSCETNLEELALVAGNTI